MATFIPIIQNSLCKFKKIKGINSSSDMLLCNIHHGSLLSQKFINDDYFEEKYLTIVEEKKWQSKSELPISLLLPEGMSARSHHRLRQSVLGLDNAVMDFQASHYGTRVGQEISLTKKLSWINWEYPLIILSLSGAILFTFIILLIWLKRQMSSEKKTSDCDRCGLVEDGGGAFVNTTTTTTTTINDKKIIKICEDKKMQVQWMRQEIFKSPSTTTTTTTQTNQSLSETKTLPSEMITAVPLIPPPPSLSSDYCRPEPIRIKAKGLLERRGSSASLTIELTPVPSSSSSSESPQNIVTPTRECTAEEYLLSASNLLSRTQLKKIIKNPTLLHKEFWEIPLNVPDKIDIFGAGIKNRYSSVLPNIQSRVILDDANDPIDNYINANYIRGYDGENCRYIATQGPLSNTIVDFWKMVWMDKVSAIVMITKLYEASKTKCDMYFPIDNMSRINAGPFTIIMTSSSSSSSFSDVDKSGYTIRDFEIRMEGQRRNVTHYWYDSWPDHAVPQCADSLVSLAAKVNSLPGPIIVHCSAGIGRTGCFIALATGITQLTRDDNVDVLAILCQMRYDRGGMIQTAEQYEFVHRALCLFEQTLGPERGSGPKAL